MCGLTQMDEALSQLLEAKDPLDEATGSRQASYKSQFYSQGISKMLQEEGKRILSLGSGEMILLYLSWILRDSSWAKGNRARQEGGVQSVRKHECVCVSQRALPTALQSMHSGGSSRPY